MFLVSNPNRNLPAERLSNLLATMPCTHSELTPINAARKRLVGFNPTSRWKAYALVSKTAACAPAGLIPSFTTTTISLSNLFLFENTLQKHVL